VGKKKTWSHDYWRDGQQYAQSLKTTNKKVAMQRAQKLDRELMTGAYQPPPAALTISQAIENYLDYLKTENRARKTLVKYRWYSDHFSGLPRQPARHQPTYSSLRFISTNTERTASLAIISKRCTSKA
jgi:hypothetical protein